MNIYFENKSLNVHYQNDIYDCVNEMIYAKYESYETWIFKISLKNSIKPILKHCFLLGELELDGKLCDYCK